MLSDHFPRLDKSTLKNKLTHEELIPFLNKLLGNLVEDTVEKLDSLRKETSDVHSFSACADDEMMEEVNPRARLTEKQIKTMQKVLHNVPLLFYTELDYGDAKLIPLIQQNVLQQQVYNLCGYHMSHTLVNFVNYLKSGGKTVFLENISSSASFWSFHHSMTSFLEFYATRQNFDRTKYPWKAKDLKYGDYERTYDKVFSMYHPLYLSTYKSSPTVTVERVNIEMQFGRFITDFDELMRIQKLVDEFMVNPLSTPIKVMAFQLGCTCHWVGLLAVIVSGQLFFYFLDSKNVNCYGLSDEKILQLVDEINEERVKAGREAWNEFRKNCQFQSMKDMNILLKLVPDMFMKKNNIYEHILKTNFKEQYQTYWSPSIVQPLSNFKRGEDGMAHDHLVDYWGDLKTFLHYIFHMTRGHEFLGVESKETLLEVYLEVFPLFDKYIGLLGRYIKGRELIDLWERTKVQLGTHFQPKYAQK